MTESTPTPTVAIGVGQAGIDTLGALAETVERNGQSNRFDYVAIDTDPNALSGAPERATRLHLDVSEQFILEDKGFYPYLTPSDDVPAMGTARQRPVGRYKLDSRGPNGFDEIFDELRTVIRSHASDIALSLETPVANTLNIVLLHSLGGGTGSGTFPLVSAMIQSVVSRLPNLSSDEVYVTGVGVVSNVDIAPELTPPPGNPMYYPNAYAALEDLRHLLNADAESLELPVYAAAAADSDTRQSFDIGQNPFDDYWLVGVDEDLIAGGLSAVAGPETYREALDRRVAESVYALATMRGNLKTWSPSTVGSPTLNTVGQATMRVPHERVQQFRELLAERDETERLVSETFPTRLDALDSEKERLETLKRTPSAATDHLSLDEEETVDERVDSVISDCTDLTDDAAAAVEVVLDDIESSVEPDGGVDIADAASAAEAEMARQPAALLLATDLLDDRLTDLAERVEDEWRTIVAEQWRTYDMAARPAFSDDESPTFDAKARSLGRFFDEMIEETREFLEHADSNVLERMQELVPPYHPLFESDQEAAERRLAELREQRETLRSADERYRRLQSVRTTVDDYRQRARRLLDDRLASVNEALSDTERELEAARQRLTALNRDVDRERDELTVEHTGSRVAVVPLEVDALENSSPDDLAELDSLDAYVERGLVEEQTVLEGIETWMNNSVAWELPESERNFEDVDQTPTTSREMWCLYHEDNESYVVEATTNAFVAGAMRYSKGDGTLDYLDDPYTISFVSHLTDVPVEALTLYQELDEMAENGVLDEMAERYDDFLRAFAYPEWHGRRVLVHRNGDVFELPRPPKLDADKVRKSDRDRSETNHLVGEHELHTYLWRGTVWDAYGTADDGPSFEGWQSSMQSAGITYTMLSQGAPDDELTSNWLTGRADWDDILQAYRENLEELTGRSVEFV